MSDPIAIPSQSPSGKPEPSTNPVASDHSSISDTDGLEGLAPAFAPEESKEDSTTLNHDAPQSLSDTRSLQQEPDKRLLISQSTQPIDESVELPTTAPDRHSIEQQCTTIRGKPPKTPLLPSHADKDPLKSEVARRPKTADVYLMREERGRDEPGRTTPPGSRNIKLVEEIYPGDRGLLTGEKRPSKPSSPIVNQHRTSDPDLPEDAPESPLLRPAVVPQSRIPTPQARVPTPPQPEARLPSPHIEEAKAPSRPASQNESPAPGSPHSISSESGFLAQVEVSIGESQPRPADSLVEPFFPQPANEITVVEQVILEEPQPYRRKRSFDDPFIMPARKTTPTLESHPACVTYRQCLTLLRNTDLSGFVPHGVMAQPRNCCQAAFLCCFPVPMLPEGRRVEFDTLMALHKRPIGALDVDVSMLYSLWRLHFPSESFALESEVWTGLGFRNSDPRAEASTLEFLQLLYLSQEKKELTESLLVYSRTRGTMFNFALEVIALMKLVVKIAKSGSLTRIFLKSSSDVFDTFNQYFVDSLLLWFSEHQQTGGRVDWKQLELRLRGRTQEVYSS